MSEQTDERRTPERLAAGLNCWPREKVLALYETVKAALSAEGMAAGDSHEEAYRGVMALGSVCSARGLDCLSAAMVMLVIEGGRSRAINRNGRN